MRNRIVRNGFPMNYVETERRNSYSHNDASSDDFDFTVASGGTNTERNNTRNTATNPSSQQQQSKALVERIVRRETRFVQYLRCGLFVILLGACATSTWIVFERLSTQETQDFHAAFIDYSTKLTTEFQSIAVRRLGAIAAFATSITSNALLEQDVQVAPVNNLTSTTNNSNIFDDDNTTSITKAAAATAAKWPFVMIPQFEAQFRYVAKIASLPSIAFAPIVTIAQRTQWEEEFVPQYINRWITECIRSKDIYNEHTNETIMQSYYVGPAVRNDTHVIVPGYRDKIFGSIYNRTSGQVSYEQIPTYNINNTATYGPFMPLWQVAPYRPIYDFRLVNHDMSTDPTFTRGALIRILNDHKAALGRISTNAYGEYGNGNPTSGFYYPVLTDLPNNSTVAGSLITLIFWLPFFSNILPDSAVGMVGVLQNTCQQQFTFRIDGGNVTYIGPTDAHDPKYDHLRQSVSFSTLIMESFERKQYLGFPIDDTGCQYTLSVYPSEDLEAEYKTNNPTIAAIVVVAIFITTALLFIIYDRLVERRQKLVQKEAASSGAIVSSLFPAAYRDRLMEAQSNPNTTNKIKIHSVLRRNSAGGAGGGEGLEGHVNNTKSSKNDQPIADLYQNCTVLFADIAGFTHWSSSREPVEVFCLLQAIYGAMDKIAKKYSIFKVETIGDCYMAVTGLPNPQSNHAQLMARFASDCLERLQKITKRLSRTLGDDTGNLQLRIGLHSGPVTAGILRGEKSRFQLFGDTVNTASRMESTGERNRIQISSSTAEILRDAGKADWIQPREDLVEVKGKGKLQTWWLVYNKHENSYFKSAPTAITSTLESPYANEERDDGNDGDESEEDEENYYDSSNIVYQHRHRQKRRRKSVGELFDI